MKGLREYIRFLIEAEVLGEPDMSAEDERKDGEDEDEQSAGGVPGPALPLGVKSPAYPADDPRKKKAPGPKTKKDKDKK